MQPFSVSAPPRRQAGFTLLELLVVTVVLGILAALSMTTLFAALDRGKQRATMADMRTIARAIEAYSVDNSELPTDSGGMPAMVPLMVPYCTQVLPIRDHWGNEYAYVLAGPDSYSLISYGKDGVDGADYTGNSILDYDGDLVVFNGVFVMAPN